MYGMILVDSHCHLDLISEKEDLDLIISRSLNSNVKFLQTICTSIENFQRILDIATKYDQVFTSVGVHPHEVNKRQQVHHTLLEELSIHRKVIAFGETGLDYYYGEESKKQQLDSFEQHIIAASNTSLPLVIHIRNAELDAIEILRSQNNNISFRGVIHCFTSTIDFAKKMLDIGMYISISGIVTFKNADTIRDVVKFVPLDRLLIETDSPYLAPVPMRGKQNEPSFVQYVAHSIAELKCISLEEVAQVTTSNFFQLFSRAKKFNRI